MLAACRFGAMHYATDFHDISTIRVGFNEDGRKAELEPGAVMGWSIYDITLIGVLESSFEGDNGIFNTNGELIISSNVNNKT